MELTEKIMDKIQVGIGKIKPTPLTYDSLVEIECGTINYLSSLGIQKNSLYVNCKKWDEERFVVTIEQYKNKEIKKFKRLI